MLKGRWLTGAVSVAAAALIIWVISNHRLVDLEVYRAGGATWLANLDLYSSAFPSPLQGPALPFTYPPLAAVLFAPLALTSLPVALYIATIGSLVAAGVTLYVAMRDAGRLSKSTPAFAFLLLLACIVLEPVRSTFFFGQVNLYLMALVVVDCFVLPRRYRGVLVGLAASIKLIPLGFLLFFLIERDWRAIRTTVLSFVAMTGLAFAVAPGDSWRYWTQVLLDSQRIGNPGWATNQSLHGVLTRLLADSPWATVLWLFGAASLALVTWFAGRSLVRSGHRMMALVLVATWCLLASPISWSHHWVWILPGLVALTNLLPLTEWTSRVTFAGITLLFVGVAAFWGPLETNDRTHWTVWQNVYGNAYALAGIAVLLAAGRWAYSSQRNASAATVITDKPSEISSV